MFVLYPRTSLRMPKSKYATELTCMREQYERLATLLQPQVGLDVPLSAQPLAAQLKVFECIAAGRLDRRKTGAALVQEIEIAVEQLLHVLYAPLDGGPMIVPRDAWRRSPLMELLAYVTYWLYEDDVISIAEAARLLYPTARDARIVPVTDLMKVRALIEAGRLRHYWKPGSVSKQRSFLVRRSAVEWLKQQGEGGAA
jgi:hypothetical protein